MTLVFWFLVFGFHEHLKPAFKGCRIFNLFPDLEVLFILSTLNAKPQAFSAPQKTRFEVTGAEISRENLLSMAK